MKVRLNRKYLDNSLEGILKLRVKPTRVAYATIGERGLPEYILTYEGRVPTSVEEPELFGIPHEEDVKHKITHNLNHLNPYVEPTEIWLKYQKATVIMISKKLDDEFRKENKDLIGRIEALYIEK